MDEGISSKWETFTKTKLKILYMIMGNQKVASVVSTVNMLGKTILYFVDFIKDVQFIIMIWFVRANILGLNENNLRMALSMDLGFALSGLLMSEVLKMFHLNSHPGMSGARGRLFVLLNPILPVLIHHREFWLRSRKHRVAI